ncbi:rhodanese-like domain-containing protein [Taibaiella sp. KBW10]|uniref:rhodanese-like domain-containing protein n=1 Tax=Taibaiella sp. KBW10 TaxID=2153357 RepID=UPI0013156C48|nr:rhodanese-like domain-containing protein [Taibaiella sp. KBW10]
MKALSIADFEQLKTEDTYIIDTRPASTFTLGFIPGSVNIGTEGKWEEWIQTLIKKDASILLVTEKGAEKKTAAALETLGYTDIKGYLKGGYNHWQAEGKRIDMIIDVTADELALDIPFDPKIAVIDVRTDEEYQSAHLFQADNFPLAGLVDPFQIALLDDEANMYVYCGGGYRSVIACSLMKREGFHNVRNILGGFNVIKETPNLKVEVPKKKI